MKGVAHLGHAWRVDRVYAFARGPEPIRTSLTRPKEDSSCIYMPGLIEQAGRDDRKSVRVAVSHSCSEHGMTMEQGLGRRSELYHGGGSLEASRVHDSSWSNRI